MSFRCSPTRSQDRRHRRPGAMRIIAVAFAIFLANVHAEDVTNLGKRDEDMVTCLIEYGLDPGIYSHRKLDSKLPTEDQKNCYLACMLKKIGYMKKDGTINVESILLHTYSPEKREEGKRKLDDILSTCKFQAGNDICKLARCFQDLRKSPK